MISKSNIEKKISRCKYGTLFFLDSFEGYSTKYVNNVLRELMEQGKLIRIAKGIYLKPQQTRFGVVYPSVSEVVNVIAKRDHAQVLPSGYTALNRLGLSEQVPAKETYVTSGSARNIVINGKNVELTTSVPKTFAPKNKVMAMLFLALKTWGPNELDGEMRQNVFRLLQPLAEQKESLKKDLVYAPLWIRKYVGGIIDVL